MCWQGALQHLKTLSAVESQSLSLTVTLCCRRSPDSPEGEKNISGKKLPLSMSVGTSRAHLSACARGEMCLMLKPSRIKNVKCDIS